MPWPPLTKIGCYENKQKKIRQYMVVLWVLMGILLPNLRIFFPNAVRLAGVWPLLSDNSGQIPEKLEEWVVGVWVAMAEPQAAHREVWGACH